MENGPFEDAFPTKDGGFHCYVSRPEGNYPPKKVVKSLAKLLGMFLSFFAIIPPFVCKSPNFGDGSFPPNP